MLKSSTSRQKEHVDDWEIYHLLRFYLVARVLFRYMIEKLKMFLAYSVEPAP